MVGNNILTPEDEYMKTASNTHVEALCMQLKSPYKEVAYAHFCKELSVPEIAQQTGKRFSIFTINTVYKILNFLIHPKKIIDITHYVRHKLTQKSRIIDILYKITT